MRFFLLVFVGLFLFSGSAQADCTAPAGIAGDQIFNSTHKTMQFCDGTNWYSMKGGVKHTLDSLSCTDGQIAAWNDGGGVWECANDDGGVTSESDPQVSAVTSGKWCRGTGSAVTCDQTAPSGGGTTSVYQCPYLPSQCSHSCNGQLTTSATCTRGYGCGDGNCCSQTKTCSYAGKI